MKSVIDNVDIEITCESCGRKISKPVGWFETHKNFTCPCGVTFAVSRNKIADPAGVVKKIDDRLHRFLK